MAKPTRPTPRRPRGRPPTGLQPGEKLTDYGRITVRLPRQAKERLMALADVTGTPAWKLLVTAVDQLWTAASDEDRKLADALAKRRSA